MPFKKPSNFYEGKSKFETHSFKGQPADRKQLCGRRSYNDKDIQSNINNLTQHTILELTGFQIATNSVKQFFATIPTYCKVVYHGVSNFGDYDHDSDTNIKFMRHLCTGIMHHKLHDHISMRKVQPQEINLKTMPCGIYEFTPRIYKTSSYQLQNEYTSIFFAHGGGYVFSNPQIDYKYFIGQLITILSQVYKLKVKVYAIDYGLAPEIVSNSKRGCFYDVYHSCLLLLDNHKQFKINLDRFMLLGDSAGGGCMLATINMMFFNQRKYNDKKMRPLEKYQPFMVMLICPAISGIFMNLPSAHDKNCIESFPIHKGINFAFLLHGGHYYENETTSFEKSILTYLLKSGALFNAPVTQNYRQFYDLDKYLPLEYHTYLDLPQDQLNFTTKKGTMHIDHKYRTNNLLWSGKMNKLMNTGLSHSKTIHRLKYGYTREQRRILNRSLALWRGDEIDRLIARNTSEKSKDQKLTLKSLAWRIIKMRRYMIKHFNSYTHPKNGWMIHLEDELMTKMFTKFLPNTIFNFQNMIL